MQRQHGANGQQQIEPGHHDEEIGEAHDDIVDLSSVEPCERSPGKTEEYGQRGRQKSGKQRDTAAIEDPRKLVAPKAIGTQQVNSCRSAHPKKMDPATPDTEQTVFFAGGEKSD